ncbi:phage-shock protein [Leptolyngbya sp. BL0902]|uniref:lecithin retinol acyltransferase family protein n=1 Tax=Leptolyngbya sp. BL0902 TaxID=1115757 RepID=UPI0018E7ABFF|nr:lecithin retinol acyltransferase family protein [Leptolyngbya sp. BL0902]QQE65282.1 phage-shock protein [Leptolyngbya sp. BL0902]
MVRSDQIYVMRPLASIQGVYQHHGIDCGDGTVIHYRKLGDDAQIERTSLEMFSWGNPIRRVYHAAMDPEDVVMQRAESRLGERQYDLFFNNCEHFATWCKIGRSESAQLAAFGLDRDRVASPLFHRWAERTSQHQTPEQALILFHRAMGDIAVAYQSALTQQQTLQQEMDTWQKVAERALSQQREDLARAALHRKVTAQRQVDDLTQQLRDLVGVELSLQQSREMAEGRGL